MKKLYKSLVAIVLIIVSIFTALPNVSAQQTITIGTASSTSDYLPTDGYYDNSWSAQIYTASEFGGASGNITEVKFNVNNSPSSFLMNNQKIYFYLTSDSSFSDASYIDPASMGAILVYDGSITWNGSGWQGITLNNPFYYSGSQNLVILWENRDGSWASGYPSFYTTTANSQSKYQYQDNVFPTSQGNIGSSKADVQFTIANPYQIDLALTEIISPNPSSTLSPNASVPVSVRISNAGSVSQSGYTVKYSIDGGNTFISEVDTTTIYPQGSHIHNFSQNANMLNVGTYNFVAQVVIANDSNTANNVLNTNIIVCVPMSGTYTIGNTGNEDFNSFNSAISAINTCGISGPVVFDVANGTYNETFTIDPIMGASSTNTVTFKGHGKDNTTINATVNGNNLAAVQINGAKHIIIDSIGIVNAAPQYGDFWGVLFKSNSDSNAVKNCFIEVGNHSYNSAGIVTSQSQQYFDYSETFVVNHLTIDNCVINHGKYGIRLQGYASSSKSEGNTITNSTFFDQSYYFVSVSAQDGIIIQNNEFVKGSNTDNNTIGIYLYNSEGASDISYNKLDLKGGTGINVDNFSSYSTSDTAYVYNNFIAMYADANSNANGISVSFSGSINFYYNSIHIYGSANSQGSSAFRINSAPQNSTPINVNNNILSNEVGGYGLFYNVSTSYINSDYNDIFNSSLNFGYISTSGSVESLSDWVSNTGMDSNSVNINPWFTTNTNLHANNFLLNNHGTPLTEIANDIDGETRSSTTPDIGADEYTPLAHNVGLTIFKDTSVDLCNMSTTQILSVQIVNYGTSSETSIPVHYKFDANTLVSETFTGSLASGDTVIYSFNQTIDLSNGGHHTIIAYTSLSTDGENANDTSVVDFDNYESISSLPFYENFEGESKYFHLEDNSNSSTYITEDTAMFDSKSILMIGSNYDNWSSGNDLEYIINNNQQHKSSAYTCEFDASALSSLKLSFDLDQQHSYDELNSWFFVTLNDTIYLKDIYGDSVWHYSDNNTLLFNLNSYVGGNIKIDFQGYFLYGFNQGESPDYARIDNVRLWEPQQNDIGVIDLKSSSDDDNCGLMVDSIYVVVRNFGSNTVSNFPVYLVGNYGSTNVTWNNTYTGSLAPDSIAKIYVGTLNTTENAQVNIAAYTALSIDSDKSNDTLHLVDYNQVYNSLPYIETFTDENNLQWNLNEFYITDFNVGNQHNNMLTYDYYGGSITGQSSGSASPFAFTSENYGKVKSNSFLTFDYILNAQDGFDDTLNFFVVPDCGQPVNVYAINSSNYINYMADNNWHNIVVPIGNFAGSSISFGVYSSTTGNYSYNFGIDNFGILSPFEYSLGNDTAICPSESLVLNTGLSLDSGYHFTWHGNGVSASDTLSSYTVSSQGNYWVEVTDSVGFTVADSIYVTVYPQIQAQLVTNKSLLCYGDSAQITPQLNGIFPMVMNWTDGSSNFTDTLMQFSSRYFSPNITTQYSITSVTDSVGCSISNPDSVTITVIPQQNIVINGVDNQYCSADPQVTLSATPLGGSFIGAGINGFNFTPNMAGPGNHNIIYEFIDTNNCVSRDTVNTTVFANPVVSIVSALDSQYCSNNLPVNLYTYPIGGSFTGSGISASVFNPALANIGLDTIIYSLTDANNCFNADTIITIVNSAPVVTINTTLDTAYCNNESPINLSATPSGGTFNGMGITDTIFNPSQAGMGQKMILYSYTDVNGCSNNDTAYTVINSLPTVLITSSLNANYCENSDSVNLSAYPSGGSFIGTGITGNTFSPTIAGVGSHQIVYNFTDINGCSNSDTVQTAVSALPTVNLAAFTQVCANQGAVNLVGGTPSGGVYVGNAVNSSQSIFYPNNVSVGLNEITYKYTDTLGCENQATNMIRVVGVPLASFTTPANLCKSDTAIVNFTANVSAAATYNWNFDNANIISGTNAGPYELKWDTSGVKALNVSVTDSGCVSNVANNYTNVIDAIATASIIGNDSACFGDNILMFANGGNGYSYQWYDTSYTLTSASDTLSYLTTSQTGRYFVKVINDIGCAAISNEIDVFVNPQITSDFSLPAIACKNDMVSVNYTGNSSASAQFIWDFDNGQIASGSAGGPYNIIWNTDSVKNVTLDVTENGCYAGLTSHSISILTTPANITALGNTSFCDGGNVTLSANSGNYSYQWYKDGAAYATTPIITTGLAGTYKVEITNNVTNCSNTSDSVVVVVNTTDFNIAFTATPTSFTIPPFNTIFNNQTPNVNDYYWMWSFGDGNSSTFVNPAHQYMFDGDYTVGVIAQNIATGCFDTLVKTDYISCTGGSANPCNLDASFGNIGGNEVCQGDSVKLYANDHTPGISYQWLRDGILLGGETDSVYYAKQTGLYQLLIADTTCSVFSQPFSLVQHTTITPSILANGTIVPCTNDSMELYVSTSFNAYQWSNGSVSPSIFVKNSGSFIVTVTDNNGCNATSQPYVVNASLLQAPEICIVGIDTATNHNRVVWERTANSLIDSFKVYRESNVAGVYNLIGSQPFSDLSVFEDVNSNPAQQAYRYRITAIDTCGMETPPSSIHKTLHLTINAGLGGVWNLIWSGYEGFNFGSYRIYRGTDSTQMTLLTQIQSTLTSYTDLNPPTGNVYYQIEVMSPHPCYPDSIYTKANTNYNSSRSNTANTNMAPNTGFVQSANSQLSMQIYPNPNKGIFTLEVISNNSKITPYVLEVYNAMGSMIHQEDIDAGSNLQKQMHFETLSKGVYFVRLRSKNDVLTTRFVVE